MKKVVQQLVRLLRPVALAQDRQKKRSSYKVKISAAREAYYAHSGNASGVARQIAFAGIAVVWLFNTPSVGTPIALPNELVLVVLLLVASLALDLLQYVVATLIWGFVARYHESLVKAHRVNEDNEFSASPFLNWPALFFFWTKFVSLFAAYFLLIKFMAQKLAAS